MMNTHTNIRKEIVLLISLLAVAIGQLLNTAKNLLINGWGRKDYIWIWKESVCTVEGEYVLDAIRNHMNIGGVDMPSASATMPYARMLANIIHPGFVPENMALFYGVVLYAGSFLFMVLLLIHTLRKQGIIKTRLQDIFVLMLILSPWYWTDAIQTWNNGALFSMFLIIMVCVIDENEYLAGALLAFAMIKPQLSGLFYIALLIRKKYKTILVSCVILAVSWGVYLCWVGGNPITQLIDILGQSTQKSAGFIWFGLFDGLTRHGVSGTGAMMLGVLFGIVFTTILSIVALKNRQLSCNIVYYSILALASTIWCYKSTTDLVILILPNLIVLYLIAWENMKWSEIGTSVVFVVMLNAKFFCGFLRRLFHYEWLLGVTYDAYVRTILFILIFVWIGRRKPGERAIVQ